MNEERSMKCRDARALVPGYVDDELSEAQAAPLRRHLLDCHSCRALVQESKSLHAWFPALPELEVPTAFAERVTALAFGQAQSSASLQPVARASRRPDALRGGAVLRIDRGAEFQSRTREFVLQMIAVAAVLLVAFSVALRGIQGPADGELQAQDGSLPEALNELDELNRAEFERLESGGRAANELPAVPEAETDEPEQGR